MVIRELAMHTYACISMYNENLNLYDYSYLHDNSRNFVESQNHRNSVQCNYVNMKM